MSIFAGVESAQVFGGGVYVIPGNYLVWIDLVKERKSSSSSERFFIAELVILESDNPKRPVGSRMSYTIKASLANFLGDVKAFIAAGFNIKHEQVTERGCMIAVSAANPMRGRLLRITAQDKEIKNPKNWQPGTPKPLFTKVFPSAVAPELQARNKELALAVGIAVDAPPVESKTTEAAA